MKFDAVTLSHDQSLRDARLWAVWNDTLHRVIFSSQNRNEAVNFARAYYGSMTGWHIVRFDVSPLYRPLPLNILAGSEQQ